MYIPPYCKGWGSPQQQTYGPYCCIICMPRRTLSGRRGGVAAAGQAEPPNYCLFLNREKRSQLCLIMHGLSFSPTNCVTVIRFLARITPYLHDVFCLLIRLIYSVFLSRYCFSLTSGKPNGYLTIYIYMFLFCTTSNTNR